MGVWDAVCDADAVRELLAVVLGDAVVLAVALTEEVKDGALVSLFDHVAVLEAVAETLPLDDGVLLAVLVLDAVTLLV